MAAIWVGGLLYTMLVVIPYAISQEAESRQRLLRGIAHRFRLMGWGTVVILIITGLTNLMTRYSPIRIGQLFNGEAFDAERVDPFIATWLPGKLALFVLMIVLMAYHDYTSIRAAKQYEAARETAPGHRAGSMAAALATLLAIAILYLSVRMVRG